MAAISSIPDGVGGYIHVVVPVPFSPFALCLAGMELIFPIAVLIVLSFVFMVRKLLITHQCLGTAEQCLCSASRLSLQLSPLISRLEEGKISGGVIVRAADPKGCSIPYDTCSGIKTERKGGGDVGAGKFAFLL